MQRRKFLKEFFGLCSFGALAIFSIKKGAELKNITSVIDLFSAPHANATTLKKQTITCPNCGTKYSDNSIQSTNTFGGMDSEFRIYATGLQPIPFFIHTCPNCGCPDKQSIWPLGGKYNDIDEFNALTKIQINNLINSYCKENNVIPGLFTASQKYEVLAKILSIVDNRSFRVAESYLYAAWMADDEDKTEKSRFYRERSINYFIKALDCNELRQEQCQKVNYLIGELYRRTGNYEQALQWFSKVKTDDKKLLKLCERQKKLCFEKNSQKAMIEDKN